MQQWGFEEGQSACVWQICNRLFMQLVLVEQLVVTVLVIVPQQALPEQSSGPSHAIVLPDEQVVPFWHEKLPLEKQHT